MSETPKKLSLDAALRAWPELEKPAQDWEEMALKVEERIRSGATDALSGSARSVDDANLLAAPLGQIEGEGHNSAASVKTAQTPRKDAPKGETMTMPVDRERDRRSLQDLAKMAQGTLSSPSLTPPPPSLRAPLSSPSATRGSSASLPPSGQISSQRPVEAKQDDSGIVDLAMAAQSDPQAAVRAQTTPLAADGLFDDEPASIRPPPVSAGPSSLIPSQPAPSMPPFSVAPASAPASMSSVASIAPGPASVAQPVAAAPTKKKKGGAVIALVFGAVALSAAAAGGFLFMKHQAKAKADAMAVALATPAPQATTPAVTEPAAPAAPVAVAAPEATMDPNALPSSPDPKAAKKGNAPVVALAPAAPKTPAATPPAAKEETAKLSQKDLPTAPTGPGGDLGAAMKGAVGADGKPVEATPAAAGPQFAAGSVPQKPSQGAVTGALGAVLPGARACLGPDDAVSRASITFTSAGTVSSVGVTGGAAGKPAEACIKGALSKAKLAPFAEPTYTANITVRH